VTVVVSPRGAGGLSRRLGETLLLLARGLTLEEIAVVQDVAEDTVKTHIKRLRERLGARNRPNIVWLAVQRGLLQPASPPGGGTAATASAHRAGYELAASRVPQDYRQALMDRYDREPPG
jgi:DNA-binding CsgD family transcriptional regulator